MIRWTKEQKNNFDKNLKLISSISKVRDESETKTSFTAIRRKISKDDSRTSE